MLHLADIYHAFLYQLAGTGSRHMTIESSGISSKFYFDLSAKFSRSFAKENTFESRASFSRNDAYSGVNYSRSNPVNLLENALSDGLGKRIDLETGSRFEPLSRAITKNILAFVKQELYEARGNGANQQELQSIINKARAGIEKGFAEAKDVLQGRFESEPPLEQQIDHAFKRIQRGIDRLDNRFAPNAVELSVSEGDDKNSSVTDINQAQSRQVEFTKTKSVQRSSSFELSIQTQEGDTVNLTIQKSFSKQFSKQATFDGQGFTVNIDRQIQHKEQVSYQVTGDINEQEQAAIDALIKRTDRLADKFYSGNLVDAFQKATRIGIDAEQLANFSVNLRSSQTYEYTKTYREIQGIPVAQQIPSPVEYLGEFVGEVADVTNDDAVAKAVTDPVPVATELFKQITIRDERYAELAFDQSVQVIDQVIEDIANLAEQQLEKAA